MKWCNTLSWLCWVRMESLFQYFGKLNLDCHNEKDCELKNLTIEGIADYILSGECKNIITMCGAGVSTAAGIPDFRSPHTGLYDNLEKYKLPSPLAIFDIDYFRQNPEPFYEVARRLQPSKYKPTLTHYFIKLLQDEGLLLRHYTQNVDGLDLRAGILPEKIVEAHGNIEKSHCLSCNKEFSAEWMEDRLWPKDPNIKPEKVPVCNICGGIVKPDVTFFGEELPTRFYKMCKNDFPKCDLLIIIGTSLQVQPFASLANLVPISCPRLLINRVKPGSSENTAFMSFLGLGSPEFDFSSDEAYRDVFYQGDCDKGSEVLAKLLKLDDKLSSLPASTS